MFDFLELWRQIVGSNSIELTPKQLAIILVEKMSPSKVLAQDVAYWRRLEDSNEQKTYEYLVIAMQRHLDRDQMEKNNSGRRAALQSGRLHSPAVTAASGADGKGSKQPCWHFHKHGSCKFGDRCYKSHSPISEEEKRRLKPPSREGSPERNTGKGKGKGKGKGSGTSDRSTSPPKGPSYCRFFLKGECKHGDKCPFPHLDQAGVDAVNRAKAVAKEQAKAKAKPKAKPKAIPLPAAVRAAAVVPDAEGWRAVRRRARMSH
jgi:hypothetical protein